MREIFVDLCRLIVQTDNLQTVCFEGFIDF